MMIVSVTVEGKRASYDLIRVRYMRDLRAGEKVVVSHPETGNLCIAMVDYWCESFIILKDTARCIAPYRWTINKKDIYRQVYKIIK